jgi:hypothetical protein
MTLWLVVLVTGTFLLHEQVTAYRLAFLRRYEVRERVRILAHGFANWVLQQEETCLEPERHARDYATELDGYTLRAQVSWAGSCATVSTAVFKQKTALVRLAAELYIDPETGRGEIRNWRQT